MGAHANGPGQFAMLAVLFELSLGLIGILLGWLTGPFPWITLVELDRNGLLVGLVSGCAAAVLLLTGIVMVDRRPIGLFRQLQQTVRQYVAPLFRGARVWHLLAISLAAGVGEELLFRGYCQAALANWLAPWGPWWAMIVASALFGICHWISPAYALVATAMGLVLGGLFLATGDLVAPIVAHALYDFLALLYLTRWQARPDDRVAPSEVPGDETPGD